MELEQYNIQADKWVLSPGWLKICNPPENALSVHKELERQEDPCLEYHQNRMLSALTKNKTHHYPLMVFSRSIV